MTGSITQGRIRHVKFGSEDNLSQWEKNRGYYRG
jgi:hypothetical protein